MHMKAWVHKSQPDCLLFCAQRLASMVVHVRNTWNYNCCFNCLLLREEGFEAREYRYIGSTDVGVS